MRPLVRLPSFARIAPWAIVAAFAFAGAPPAAISAPDDVGAAVPRLSETDLDSLVAPVALYPDVVLDSLLPAATAPFDVVEADRYVKAQGGSVTAAPDGTSWDPGVVALLQFPDVLSWMAENTSWLERLGAAMAVQPGDVLAAVQRYRRRAMDAGVLKSDEHQSVLVEPAPADSGAPAGATVIVIESVEPSVVYVPAYDPYPLLDPSWRWSPSVAFYSTWMPYYPGTYGPWSSYSLSWGWGGYGSVYAYDRPWWYGRWRPYSSSWGPDRPRSWNPRYRGDGSRVRRSSDPAVTYRPRPPSWTSGTSANRTRTTTTVTPSSDPRFSRRDGTTVQPRTFPPRTTFPSRTTTTPTTTFPVRPSVAPTTTAPSNAPTLPRTLPRTWTTPSTGTTDGRAVDVFRRRGTTSLDPNVRFTPRTSVPTTPTLPSRPTTWSRPAATPTVPTEVRRTTPTFGRPATAPTTTPSNGRDARWWRERGRRSLGE
jgi:hypothetical protein